MKKLNKSPDVISFKGTPWLYSGIVKEHFLNPKNFVIKGKPTFKFNGVGMVGSPACGDMMKIWLLIDQKTDRIKKCGWQTFGCASAIASTSVLSVMLVEKGGMKVEKALEISQMDILKRLGGLPSRKIHCSVLGDKALKAAINDYFRNTKQGSRVVAEGSRMIDKVLKITDKDIEDAVLHGAKSFEEVVERTKAGKGDPSCLPLVEELAHFYISKYFPCENCAVKPNR
ncbi:MAG: nitrogen-fixing NifU domain-containing protein, nitrogen fixation protein NifU [Candidatus Peregrinibacteria bacterium GW2011_GWF2_38_29]|nr:MAG: nitrogen-fixing NifU domain-containing protein, nitrogen fixation protein NifU [Candidatus Peregrinibacteria bacterium GW2011_GWF2_38_29]HBB02788.1 iron-sulfur cluster assembly scaffold protein [Candidatus Peregrinibacteria bacterium]